MVDYSLIDKIKGLKELFKIVPEDYKNVIHEYFWCNRISK